MDSVFVYVYIHVYTTCERHVLFLIVVRTTQYYTLTNNYYSYRIASASIIRVHMLDRYISIDHEVRVAHYTVVLVL